MSIFMKFWGSKTIAVNKEILHSVLFFMITLVGAANAATEGVVKEHKNEPIYQATQSSIPLPDIDGTAWALMEFNSGILVVGKDAKLQFPPASITKLMTNYVIYTALETGQISLDDSVAISEKAWRAEGSRMFAKVNSKVSLDKLLKSTVIQSGNDAAIALSEHTAGSEISFAQMMNAQAEKLGLRQSKFVNSTGLPDQGHLMSAVDIAKLSVAIIRDFPQYYSWYAQKSFTHNGIKQFNRNKLIWKDDSVDGLKTGFTNAAGYCLVGSARRNGQRWVAVVMGSRDERSREKSVLDLLNYGFAAYRPFIALTPNSAVTRVPVYGGELEYIELATAKQINIVIPTGRAEDISLKHYSTTYSQAPIKQGDVLGSTVISLDSKVLAKVPLVAKASIAEGSWWKRLVDDIRLRFMSEE